MHNYKSDMSHNDPNYEVEVYSRPPSRNVLGKITFWKNVGSWNVNGTCKIGNEKVDLPMSNLPISNLPNGQHQLLATTDSPTISACTTATNLSSMDVLQTFGSVTSYNRRLGTLEENLRVVQPEIEPLQTKKIEVVDIFKPTNGSAILSINDDPKTKDPPKILVTQVVTAVSVSVVSLVIGFVTAFTSPAAELLMKDLNISLDEYTWLSSFMPLAALVGGLIGGQSIEYLGRKWTIALTDVMFVLSWILTAAATNVYFMYVARSIAGLSVGIASLALPVYLGETIQPEVRGTLGLMPTAFGNTGILLCFAAGSVLRWNKLAWLGITLPIPFLILMFFLPETPRWYISKGKDAKAKEALQWLRGKKSDINEEYDDLLKAHVESEKMSSNSSISDFFCKSNMKPLLISLGLMFFQQLSGINAVIFYATTIFKMAGSSIDQNLCTIIVGVVNFVSTFIATILIDRLGRKVLLYISGASMVVTLIALGVYFYLKHLDMNVAPYGYLPLISAVIYVLGFSLGFGPVPWLMLGEILPAKIRGSAASLATSFNWACTFLVTKTFVDVINILGKHGTFWMFACVCMISLVFVFICVPETQGQSLQDIERKFVRRMSSIANLKTTPSSIS